uniref:Uncharacterized protein n=1 Tax=Arundo donax TaxID=35708 RepID=A0A0A9AZD3_ARUDO
MKLKILRNDMIQPVVIPKHFTFEFPPGAGNMASDGAASR